MTPDDYLELERTSDVKHELINGEVYAMAGGSAEHGALVLAVARALGNALEGKPCRTFSSDVRVRVESTASNFYPDVSVVCGKLATARDDEHAITNPVVLVEVLSDSTERNDRGPKAAHYRRLPSLKEYVLVSQDERRVEVQRLNEHGTWELHFYGPGDAVELKSLEATFALDAVYANPLER